MTYATPEAFKHSLETRLRHRHGAALPRGRQLFIYSRFLARVVSVIGNAATLKGGLALQLRLAGARSTKDVDLGMRGPADRDRLLERLEQAASLDLGDFLRFEVAVDLDHPELTGDGIKYDGFRFRVACQLASKVYGRPYFGLDVAFGNPMLHPIEEVSPEDWLDFMGIAPPRIPTYPIETHIAEKLHAYTVPRSTPNSRLKDLPDLALLATIRELSAARLRAALDETFRFRETHAVPTALPDPPIEWEPRYLTLATAEALPWATLADVLGRARGFLDPLLRGEAVERWDHTTSTWR